MKALPRFLLLCAACSLIGCSAIGSRVVGERYFSGVRTDYAMCFDKASIDPDSRIHPALAVVDMPFSLVGDILFLPYDALRGSSQLNTNAIAAASHE
jgi:uncharacterized protein YceK